MTVLKKRQAHSLDLKFISNTGKSSLSGYELTHLSRQGYGRALWWLTKLDANDTTTTSSEALVDALDWYQRGVSKLEECDRAAKSSKKSRPRAVDESNPHGGVMRKVKTSSYLCSLVHAGTVPVLPHGLDGRWDDRSSQVSRAG